jgi:PIN like domain
VPVKPAVPGRRYKPAAVRFYFDADVLGLAHQIAGLRPDATYPGDRGGVVLKQQRQPCPITSIAVKDPVWIPQVTALGWLIITRDAKIQEHTAEIAAVRDNGARMVALGSRDARGTFDQLEVFMCQ